MLHILRFFFSSRCRLFHNAIFFGSCNIHILNTGCAKILKEIPAPKGQAWKRHREMLIASGSLRVVNSLLVRQILGWLVRVEL